MSENMSPRPWGWNDDETLVDANGNDITLGDSNAEYFLIAVNEHDSLVAEVERLKEVEKAYEGLDKLQLDRLHERDAEIERLKKCSPWNLEQEIADLKFYLDESIEREKQLREALKKLSPYEIIQENDIQLSLCIFCRNDWDEEHAPDCEYIKLCGGGKDEA